MLLPVGAPKENDGAIGGAGAGEEPKENAAFSAPAGGVAGEAPNENGLREDGRASTELARCPNKNPPLASAGNCGLGASTVAAALGAGWPKENLGFTDSAALAGDCPPKPAKEDTGAVPNSGVGFGGSACAWDVGNAAWLAGAPNAMGVGAGVATDSITLGNPNKGMVIGSSFTDASPADCPKGGEVELETEPLLEPPNKAEGVVVFDESPKSIGWL